MRRLYETVDRRKRVRELRQAADECDRAGYPGIATVNAQHADWLEGGRR